MNTFSVKKTRLGVYVLLPPIAMQRLTRFEAVEFAVWLLVCACDGDLDAEIPVERRDLESAAAGIVDETENVGGAYLDKPTFAKLLERIKRCNTTTI